MIVVAFCTVDDGTSYEAEADLLARSLKKAGMAYHLRRVPGDGDWNGATAYKAEFCREMREAHKGPMLYLDVDAFVHRNVEDYFDGLGAAGVDFGAHWFRGPAYGHDPSKVRDAGWWMLSGTLFWGDTLGARRLLDAWCSLNRLLTESGAADGGGQKNLWYLTTCLDTLRIERLPGRYTYVFDKPFSYPEDEPCWIEHTIASRDHRGERRETENRRRRILKLRKKSLSA